MISAVMTLLFWIVAFYVAMAILGVVLFLVALVVDGLVSLWERTR